MAKTSKKKTTKKAPVKRKTATKKAVKKTTKKVVNKAPPAEVEENTSINNTISHEVKDNITPHDKFNSMIFILGLIAVIVLLIVISPVGNKVGSDNDVQAPDTFEGATLEMTINNDAPLLGDELTVTIEGKNFEDLVGFEMNVAFDPEVLEFKSSSYGDFLGVDGEKLCVPAENKGNAISKIACIKLPEVPGQPEGVDGDGNIVTLVFDTVGRGEPGFQIYDIKLLNSEREMIAHQVLIPNPSVQ